MAKKTVELDTPFRRNEKVITTRELGPIDEGASGKVQLRNGLGPWMRYWVLFDNGDRVGQISHHDLVRPDMLDRWQLREDERARAAEQAANRAESEAEAASSGGGDDGGGGGGIASQIPDHLLERSRAAKQRLLG